MEKPRSLTLNIRDNVIKRLLCSFRAQYASAGQAMVETALIIPLICLLIAGTVEVGNLLNTQNKVSTASRSGTVYGAANFSGDDFTVNNDWAIEMANISVQNLANTLSVDPDAWDMWSIKLTTDEDGTGYTEWTAVHSFGNNSVVSAAEWSTLEVEIQQDILDQLAEGGADAANLEAVSVVDFHDRSSILGISFFDPGALSRLRGLTVARVDRPPPFNSCLIMPVAMRFDQYSFYPSNYVGPSVSGYPGDPITNSDARTRNIWSPNTFAFGNQDDWDHIRPQDEIYTVPDPAVFENPNNHLANNPGVPLQFGRKGYIYEARTSIDEGDSSAFGWLDWHSPPSSGSDLAASLTYPYGNYWDPDDGYAGSPMDMDVANGRGDADGMLEIGEWVQVSNGNISSASEQIDALIINQRPVRFIVHDLVEGGGSSRIYRVAGFAVVRVIGYNFQANPETKKIGVEFIRWENSCTGTVTE